MAKVRPAENADTWPYPALLTLWRVGAVPMAPEPAKRLRGVMANVDLLGLPGLQAAASGDAPQAVRLAMSVLKERDSVVRDIALSALLLCAGSSGACAMVLEKARAIQRRRGRKTASPVVSRKRKIRDRRAPMRTSDDAPRRPAARRPSDSA